MKPATRLWIIYLVVGLTSGFEAKGSPAPVAAVPTFSKQVAPILFKNCIRCHRPGEIAAAVSFLSYDSVRPWAKSIKQKVLSREMPPWPADPKRSLEFRDNARLRQEDIDTLVTWVNAGAPRGNEAELPPIPEQAQGWLHPLGLQPDLVISMPEEFHAPAKGEIPYVRFLAKVPFFEDKWVVASQARPGNPSLVHHMAITEVMLDNGVTPADLNAFALLGRQLGLPDALAGARPAVTDPSNPTLSDMLAVYTPGSTFETYGEDSAKLLKGGKNMYIDFNVHYQSTGTPEKDRSMIALWFRRGPPKQQLLRAPATGGTIIANGRELLTDTPGPKAEGTRVAIPAIPPQASNYELIGVTGYTTPVTIYQFHPHAHLRGKDFTYTVVYPDGREQTVLTVPKFDFRWQLAYQLQTPLKLPAGSKLVVTAHYDNSLNNASNPAPKSSVQFRPQNQSWDEMFTPFIQYSIDTQELGKPPEKTRPQQRESKTNGLQPKSSAQTGLPVIETVGCLSQSSDATWMLTDASEPALSNTQSTDSVALKAAAARSLGDRRYRLLGVSIFNAALYRGQKVAVKGILIAHIRENLLNVTSLQMAANTCVQSHP